MQRMSGSLSWFLLIKLVTVLMPPSRAAFFCLAFKTVRPLCRASVGLALSSVKLDRVITFLSASMLCTASASAALAPQAALVEPLVEQCGQCIHRGLRGRRHPFAEVKLRLAAGQRRQPIRRP